jgi:hypothetical protein
LLYPAITVDYRLKERMRMKPASKTTPSTSKARSTMNLTYGEIIHGQAALSPQELLLLPREVVDKDQLW